MRTPIAYYGGKQKLIKEIIPLIPRHKQYVEPFFGGGAVFFAKDKSKNEAINDLDKSVINFYKVLQNNFKKLQKRIKETLHHEHLHTKAHKILKKPMKDKIEYAWAFWVQTNMSFGNTMFGGFAFSNDGEAKNTRNKRKNFDERYLNRIEHAEIFCRDAIGLIKIKDSKDTFFYVDPPYVSSDCGHYKGYTKKDFRKLLITLANIKGKFLLSSYPEDDLIRFRKKHKWNKKDRELNVAVTGKRKGQLKKLECLTWNYKKENTLKSLF